MSTRRPASSVDRLAHSGAAKVLGVRFSVHQGHPAGKRSVLSGKGPAVLHREREQLRSPRRRGGNSQFLRGDGRLLQTNAQARGSPARQRPDPRRTDHSGHPRHRVFRAPEIILTRSGSGVSSGGFEHRDHGLSEVFGPHRPQRLAEALEQQRRRDHEHHADSHLRDDQRRAQPPHGRGRRALTAAKHGHRTVLADLRQWREGADEHDRGIGANADGDLPGVGHQVQTLRVLGVKQ